MNGREIFVDTNILIRFLKGDAAVLGLILDNEVRLSFISELELYSKPSLTGAEETAIKNLLHGCMIYPYSNDMKETVISIRRTARLKLPDAIVAATAMQHRLNLLTSDKGFGLVTDLRLVLIN